MSRLFSRAGRDSAGLMIWRLLRLRGRSASGRRLSGNGEIAVLGSDGRSLFRALLARCNPARFQAFDLLWLMGATCAGCRCSNARRRPFNPLPEDYARCCMSITSTAMVPGSGGRLARWTLEESSASARLACITQETPLRRE